MNDGSGIEPGLNRLAEESSPYLLQHKENPVDWYPWGKEAFAEAQRRDVPVLVSIGYSTCHWCHVMAHESFEDPEVAAVMNDRFVSIKVDREERPDIDALYLQAVQAMGHQAGWPLNVFLTPDGEPFFGGTYWPKHDQPPMPGFQRVLATISSKWQDDNENLLKGSQEVAEYLRKSANATPSPSPVTESLSNNAVEGIRKEFDQTWGGFGGAPKFPQPSAHRFLLRHYRRTGDEQALQIVEQTFEKMAEGGIHDQLGGGFARYSVDERWHVPHFEKMLYDNAQILELATDLWQITHDNLYRDVALGIVSWLEREMTTERGGFAAALDADTEGVEGKYYIWSAAEVDALLPPESADLVKLHFGISDPGSFEGKTVLSVVKSVEEIAEQSGQEIDEIGTALADAKSVMLAARQKRVAPGRDDKVIAGWNGLMIQALAGAGRAFGQPSWIEMASRAAGFILDEMHHEDGSLSRSWNQGKTRGNGVLEDYACLAFGLRELYVATANYRWLLTSADLVAYAVSHFRHPSGVGFYDTSDSSEEFIARPRELTDTAVPSGNGMMTEMLYIFGVMLQSEGLTKSANSIIESMSRPIADHPLFLGQFLSAAQYRFESPRELVFAGDPESDQIQALRDSITNRFEPLLLVGYNDPADTRPAERFPMLADRPVVDGGAAYVCRDFTCLPAVTTAEELATVLDR